MFGLTHLGLFIAASWALIIAPGPDMLYVITRGMAGGRRAGLLSAAGVVCGILVHTTAAACGLALILQASATAFQIIKYAGAGYLIYLGIKSWLDKGAFPQAVGAEAAGTRRLFWQGVMSNVFNPKVAIFFLAFLPQFVTRNHGHVALQMLLLGLIFACFGLCFLAAVGWFAGALGAWLARRPRCSRLLRWLTGGVLVGLGLRLAVLERS